MTKLGWQGKTRSITQKALNTKGTHGKKKPPCAHPKLNENMQPMKTQINKLHVNMSHVLHKRQL